jgi:hypothetical protein
MQSMKGATQILGSMNRSMNLPALQRIAMEFERENDIMDQRQEMMDDAIDDMTGVDEEVEGDEVVEQVLEEIGVDLRQAVSSKSFGLDLNSLTQTRWAKLLLAYKALQYQRRRLLRPSEEGQILGMTICKLDWIVYGAKAKATIELLYSFHCVGANIMCRA